jgi:hypothetical protein
MASANTATAIISLRFLIISMNAKKCVAYKDGPKPTRFSDFQVKTTSFL